MQHWRIAPDFPQFGHAFLMTTEDSLSVRAECCGKNLVNSRERTANGLARARIPKLGGEVGTGCQQDLAVATELNRFHSTLMGIGPHLLADGSLPNASGSIGAA